MGDLGFRDLASGYRLCRFFGDYRIECFRV